MSISASRVTRGVPSGGQFATRIRPEDAVVLAAPVTHDRHVAVGRLAEVARDLPHAGEQALALRAALAHAGEQYRDGALDGAGLAERLDLVERTLLVDVERAAFASLNDMRAGIGAQGACNQARLALRSIGRETKMRERLAGA